MTDKFDHVFICPSDFDKSLAFYRDVLGFSVTSQWGRSGEPRGVQLSRGEASVVLAEHHTVEKQDLSWSEGRRGHAPTIHLATPDADNRFGELPQGVHLKISPENTHWGTRWFVVEDPDGNLIAYEGPAKAGAGGQ